MGWADVLYPRTHVCGERRVVFPVQAIISRITDAGTYADAHDCTDAISIDAGAHDGSDDGAGDPCTHA
jgi:hypothetical protein